MHYNISLGLQKNFYFFFKKIFNAGMGIPERVGDGDRVQFLIPVEYG